MRARASRKSIDRVGGFHSLCEPCAYVLTPLPFGCRLQPVSLHVLFQQTNQPTECVDSQLFHFGCSKLTVGLNITTTTTTTAAAKFVFSHVSQSASLFQQYYTNMKAIHIPHIPDSGTTTVLKRLNLFTQQRVADV